MSKLRIGSDFTGIGAYNHNLKRCGIDYDEIFACDFNLYARISFLASFGTPNDLMLAKSKKHKKFAIEVEKICLGESELDPQQQKELLHAANEYAHNFSFYYPFNVYDREIPKEPLDEYCATPPCQSFSLAGKREGKDSTKGILFFNSHEFIDKNRPRFFRFENVKGLLSDDAGKTFKEWLNMLGGKSVNGIPTLFPDEQSVPYHIYYRVLNSKNHGVPQNRERVFIVGIRDDADNVFAWPKEEYLTTRLKDILEIEVDEKYFLSHEQLQKLIAKKEDGSNGFGMNILSEHDISPTIISGGTAPKDKAHVIKVGNINPSGNGINGNIFDSNGISPTLTTNKGEGIKVKIKSPTKNGYEEVTENDSIDLKSINNPNRGNIVYKDMARTLDHNCSQGVIQINNPKHSNNRIYHEYGCSPTLNTMQGGNRQPFVLQLNPSKESNKSQPYKQNRIYDGNGISPTLDTECGRPKYLFDFTVRRLTPRECWRLMDFPDEAIQKAIDAGVSDSQLYKQAGNSIVVVLLVGITKGLKRLIHQ